jgi:hypothetical protein
LTRGKETEEGRMKDACVEALFTFCLFLRKEGDDGEIRMRIREACADFSQSGLAVSND